MHVLPRPRRPLARAVVATALTVAGLLGAVGLAAADDEFATELSPGTPCTRSADICIDLGARKAWLIDRNGDVMHGPVPISSGGPGHETPRGTFHVQWKHRDHHSKEFDGAPMPFAVFFADGGIATHGGDINSPSRGCVRLALPEAERFFDFAEVDDEVQVR